jgi:hypothetical protein
MAYFVVTERLRERHVSFADVLLSQLSKRLQKQSCPFLPFSKQEAFPDSVSVHEFNAGSLQSGLDRLYGLLGNQSSLFFKIDDRR